MGAPLVVQTVLGDIEPDDLGVTMCHEHLLIDQRAVTFREPEATEVLLARQAVSLPILGWIAWNWVSNLDNLVLDDEAIAIEEACAYVAAGGASMVDCTLTGIGRNPAALARIASASNLQVIMGAGYYAEATYPPNVYVDSVDDITSEIIRDFRSGVGDSGIRAGVIGEIGSSWPMTDAEHKVFRAAGAAQAELSCGISVHPGRHPDSPFEIVDVLRRAGADPKRVIIGHIERTIQRTDSIGRLADLGCFIEYDLFGTEVTSKIPYRLDRIDMPSDAQRIDQIRVLIDSGYGDQILLSQDVCTKHRTRRFGGLGYDHVLRDVVQWMPERGIALEWTSKMLEANPRRALALPKQV